MISLKALPPYLAHILIGCEQDEIKCPDFNVELINSSCIYSARKTSTFAHSTNPIILQETPVSYFLTFACSLLGLLIISFILTLPLRVSDYFKLEEDGWQTA